jgi:leucyl aminopeptidase
MEFSVKSGNPEKQRSACVVAGVFEPRRLSPAAQQIDKISDGFLSNLLRRGDLEGKPGQTLLLHNVPGMLSDRVLLVGCGRERDFTETVYKKAIATAVNTLNETGAMEAVCFLTELGLKGRNIAWKVRKAVEAANETVYRFDRFKTEKKPPRRPLRKFVLNVPTRRDLAPGEAAVRQGQAIATGVRLAKELANLPGNHCTPTYLAEQARSMPKVYKNVKTTVLEQADMEKLGMGALLSVTRGSRQPPKFIIMEYKGGPKGQAPVVLVGKGITFDSGGISIKPGAAMDEMKFDMAGAAAVIGTLTAALELQMPINLVGLVPSCENLPDGNASKPGDVVTSLSGQTIEILNTDAEGRLILCDALTYAERYEPATVIDVATLTGACVIALGNAATGLFSNHNPLAHELLAAGTESADRCWQLPLWEEYQELLDTNFADMANVGGREAGAVTAACFLSRFTGNYHWAHLDIAGTAWKGGKEKGATGRPVSMLTQYLLNCCGQGE